MSAKVLVGLTLCAAVVACKPKASGGGAASVKEGDATAAPLDPQSQKVIDFVAELGGVDNFERVPAMKKLRAMTAEQLDEVFEDSETPGAVRGCVVGTHVVPSTCFDPERHLGAATDVPCALMPPPHNMQSAWRGKCFDGNVMLDITTMGLQLHITAAVSTATMNETLAPTAPEAQAAVRDYNYATQASATAQSLTRPDGPRVGLLFVDQKPSLITDYRPISAAPSFGGAQPTRPWVDELRVYKDDPRILIGRSTYAGKFWGHVLLYALPDAAISGR